MVVGSGYIAVELAGILKALGSDVTIIVRYNKVLRSFDSMLSDSLMDEMAAAGINVVKFSKVTILIISVAEEEKGSTVDKKRGKVHVYKCIHNYFYDIVPLPKNLLLGGI